MWAELKRIIKPNGAIVLFGSEPFSSALRMSNIKQYKYDWIWEKNRPTDKFNAKNRPMWKHELISIFSDWVTANVKTNNKMKYFPQGLEDCAKEIRGTTWKWESTKRKSHKEKYILEKTWYPTSILKYPKDTIHLHNTQKPVALIEYLIKTYTNEWETVLDFTAGSFTTAIACENTNRKWICIEQDQWYFDIWINRLNNHNIVSV